MSGAPAQSSQVRTRPGFTLLEVMLALALGALVMASALSVFVIVFMSQSRVSARLDDSFELAMSQQVVRRAMGSLLAARPKDPERLPLESDDASEDPDSEDPNAADEALAEEDPAGGLAELVQSLTGDEELALELAAAEDNTRPNFELYFDDSTGSLRQILEVKVMESPVPTGRDTGVQATLDHFLPVRGVFEVLPDGENGFSLSWRAIEPPGPSFTLARRLARVEWYILPRSIHGSGWADVHAAYLQEYYPVAVRLVVWTINGTHTDWLFDTAVTTPDEK